MISPEHMKLSGKHVLVSVTVTVIELIQVMFWVSL